MGHMIICSYINKNIQYTPTVPPLQTHLIQLCSYVLSFAQATWLSVYKPLSQAFIPVFNLP